MSVKYNLPNSAYNPLSISHGYITESQAKTEYQRLRRVAEKRLARMAEAGYDDTPTYQNTVNRFKPYSELKGERELAMELTMVKRFLDAATSNLTGIHRIEDKTLKSLHEHGYTGINRGNLRAFGRFMEAARLRVNEKVLKGSDRVAELYEEAERKGIPPDELLKDFGYWLENLDNLKDSRRSKAKAVSAATYRRNIERRKRAARR